MEMATASGQFALYNCEGVYYFKDYGVLHQVAASLPVDEVWDTNNAVSIPKKDLMKMDTGAAYEEQHLAAMSSNPTKICLLYILGGRKYYKDIAVWGSTGFTQGHGTVAIVSSFDGYQYLGPIN